MNYTVNQLAKVSGVTVRTLHFYDEIGLLKPSFVAENGYRYYQEKELLILQQILFLRELGFELKQISQIMKSGDFDKLTALQAHQQAINQKIDHLRELLVTLEKTINHLQGKQKMTEQEMFYGLNNYSPEFQQYYRDLVTSMPGKAKEQHYKAFEYQKNMTPEEKQRFEEDQERFWRDIVTVFKKGLKKDDSKVQTLIKLYFSFAERSGIKTSQQAWLAAADSWRFMQEGTQKMEVRFPELAPVYAKMLKPFKDNPGLTEFLGEAMKHFAQHNLAPDNNATQSIFERTNRIREYNKNMSPQEKLQLEHVQEQFWHDVVSLFRKGLKIEHPEVQHLMKNYVNFTEIDDVHFTQEEWMMTAESFHHYPARLKRAMDLSPEMAAQCTEKLKPFEENSGLADFLAEAMKLYVTKNLS